MEVEQVLAELANGNEARLFAFAEKHGQSLDWIVAGDLVPMLRTMARGALNQLPLPLENERQRNR
jgi:hypothetical protein